ncbi:MAG: 1,4-alpha-glucan branching protein domain-containing protein [Vicinamibacteria bacterium]
MSIAGESSPPPNPLGFWCPVLHAHLPFVRHAEHEHFLEEDWLYEAVIETYLPLLRMMDHLTRDRVRFRLTLTLSPPLLAMMQDPLLMKRCERRIKALLRLAARKAKRTAASDHGLLEATLFAEQDLASLRELFVSTYRRDLVGAFWKHRAEGSIEIITCAATHGFLPLMRHNEQAVRAQIQVATRDFRRVFGADPEGIWLPECGYFEGVEEYLLEVGLRYSFLESHGLTDSFPPPRHGVMAPIMSTGGIVFFGRDMDSSRQVWSSEVGYPGEPDYREFYKDAGWELPLKELGDFMKPDEPRRPVGLKRHRVTGKLGQEHKEPYVRAHALMRVGEHAAHFAEERRLQALRARPHMDRPPLIVSPYDAELFGHWWYEGPQFLEQVFRNLDLRHEIVATTPPAYLARFDECDVATPEMSTWGAQGYASVWLNETNDWIYPHYDAAARRMTRLADSNPSAEGLLARALNQAARELLLAQSSDWAFIMKTGTMVEYATGRVTEHLVQFAELAAAIEANQIDEGMVDRYEKAWPIFPALDYRVYCSYLH